jgi:hypothetical protein
LEGRNNDCPNLLPDEPPGSPGAPTSELQPAAEPSIAPYPATETLYSGLPLEIDEAREFTGGARAIVVALVGMIESGKTSLLARLHQQFQNGPVGGYDFAGSRTLLRFEELNWLATIESGVGAPTMPKSSRQYDNSFLHFTVRQSVNSTEPVEMLLNDISGETYPEAITMASVCEQLICLGRADHLAVVVDGAAIARRDLRHDHCAKAKNFVQRVLQTGQIGKETVLHLIISKLDVLMNETQRAENVEAAERLEADFVAQFTDKVAQIHRWRIAARPMDGSFPTEETIAKLFATWAGSTYRYAQITAPPPDPAMFARDFSRFGV